MKTKLKLDLDGLSVETFETAREDGVHGTVRGYRDTYSCGGTCGASPPETLDGCRRPTTTLLTEEVSGCFACCM